MVRATLTILLLAFLSAAALGQTWQEQMVGQINLLRSLADRAELQLYGELFDGPRLPLTIHPKLTRSADWWCQALQGTGILAHGWYVNRSGYLIAGPTDPAVISRVWLPQSAGFTSWLDRNAYLGLAPLGSGENGAVLKHPSDCVSAWTISGWSADPRKATLHYSNLIKPAWTHVGIAHEAWSAGKQSVFAEFATLR